MSQQMTPGNLLKTSTTPWNSYRNTGTLTTLQEPTPQITSHYIKASWEPMEVSSAPVQQTIALTTAGNPTMMRNMILAALSRTISPQMMTASYDTPGRAQRTAKTLEC